MVNQQQQALSALDRVLPALIVVGVVALLGAAGYLLVASVSGANLRAWTILTAVGTPVGAALLGWFIPSPKRGQVGGGA